MKNSKLAVKAVFLALVVFTLGAGAYAADFNFDDGTDAGAVTPQSMRRTNTVLPEPKPQPAYEHGAQPFSTQDTIAELVGNKAPEAEKQKSAKISDLAKFIEQRDPVEAVVLCDLGDRIKEGGLRITPELVSLVLPAGAKSSKLKGTKEFLLMTRSENDNKLFVIASEGTYEGESRKQHFVHYPTVEQNIKGNKPIFMNADVTNAELASALEIVQEDFGCRIEKSR